MQLLRKLTSEYYYSKVSVKLNSILFHRKFRELSAFTLGGHVLSPIKHLYLKNEQDPSTAEKILRKISDRCIEHGLAVIKADYLTIEKCPPTPSIRIAVNRLLDDKDIDFAFKILEESSNKLL